MTKEIGQFIAGALPYVMLLELQICLYHVCLTLQFEVNFCRVKKIKKLPRKYRYLRPEKTGFFFLSLGNHTVCVTSDKAQD